MSGKPIRAAVIGLGRIGSSFDDEIGAFQPFASVPHSHAASYQAAEEVTLVAGADPHPGQREAFIRKWEFDRNHVYADYREMLERERPEIVSICTTAKPRPSILLAVVKANAGAKGYLGGKTDSLLARRGRPDGRCLPAGGYPARLRRLAMLGRCLQSYAPAG